MKSFKNYAPVLLIFAVFATTSTSHAQATYAKVAMVSFNKSNVLSESNTTIGLVYQTTINQLNSILVNAIKSNDRISYKGHVTVAVNVSAEGNAAVSGFNRAIPHTLKKTITKSVASEKLTPIRLNGISKAHEVRIPLYIK